MEKRELIWKPGRAGNNRHPQDRRVFSFSFWIRGFNSNSSGFERCSTELLRISTRAIQVDLNFETTIVYFNAAEFSVHVTNRFFLSIFLSFFPPSLWIFFFFPFFNVRSTNGQWGRKFFFNPYQFYAYRISLWTELLFHFFLWNEKWCNNNNNERRDRKCLYG